MSGSFNRRLIFPLALAVLLVFGGLAAFLAVAEPDITLFLTVLSFAALVIILLSAVIIVIATKPTVQTIEAVRRALRRMGGGELSQKVEALTDDESADLAFALNQASAGLGKYFSGLLEDRIRLKAVLAGMTDGVILTDKDGRVVLTNPAAQRLFHFKNESAEGRPLIRVIPDYEIDAALKKSLADAGEEALQVESYYFKRHLQVIAAPLAKEENKGALMIFHDRTESESVRESHQEFVANVSHELKTPLASIKAIVETLEDGGLDDKELTRDFLEKLNAEANRMTQMVSALLEHSRVETAKANLFIEKTDINLLIKDVLTELTPQIERQKLIASTALSPYLPSIPLDREQIRQVLVNIIYNAVKFTPPGGKINVTSSLEDNLVNVDVTDTGVGISPEDTPHIFEPFYKADKSRSSGGTGLGLHISRRVVQAHGGTLSFVSELGKGTTFTVRLPLSPELPR